MTLVLSLFLGRYPAPYWTPPSLLARDPLAQQPHILLLDEPISHRDLGNQGRVMSVVRGLASEGVPGIFTTHDPNLAAAVALTPRTLPETYGVPVEVLQVEGRTMIFPGI